MKINLHNPYGYKVCYKEKFSKNYYIERFLTHTYKDAVDMKKLYLTFKEYENKKLIWFILPITKKEFKRGIWNQCPF